MKIINEELLHCYRQRGQCEHCLRARNTDPHHIFTKGMGGANRLDHAWNLIALCRVCHRMHHDGNISLLTLKQIVADRERTTVDAIETEIFRLRRAPNGTTNAT